MKKQLITLSLTLLVASACSSARADFFSDAKRKAADHRAKARKFVHKTREDLTQKVQAGKETLQQQAQEAQQKISQAKAGIAQKARKTYTTLSSNVRIKANQLTLHVQELAGAKMSTASNIAHQLVEQGKLTQQQAHAALAKSNEVISTSAKNAIEEISYQGNKLNYEIGAGIAKMRINSTFQNDGMMKQWLLQQASQPYMSRGQHKRATQSYKPVPKYVEEYPPITY